MGEKAQVLYTAYARLPFTLKRIFDKMKDHEKRAPPTPPTARTQPDEALKVERDALQKKISEQNELIARLSEANLDLRTQARGIASENEWMQ